MAKSLSSEDKGSDYTRRDQAPHSLFVSSCSSAEDSSCATMLLEPSSSSPSFNNRSHRYVSSVVAIIFLVVSVIDVDAAAVPPPEASAYIHQQLLHTDKRDVGIDTRSQLRVSPRVTLPTTTSATTRSRTYANKITDAIVDQRAVYDISEQSPSATAKSSTSMGQETTRSKSDITTTAGAVVPQSNTVLSPRAIVFMALLSLQFGLQPMLVRRFTPSSINKSTVVFVQEVIKLVVSFYFYLASTSREQQRSYWGGRPHFVVRQLAIAGLPAALYCIQNLASLLAYQNLDPVAFNVLNQTKTLSAALCCYLVLGARQSGIQVVALGMLLSAALVLEKILPLSLIMPRFGSAANAATSKATSGGLLNAISDMMSSGSGVMARRISHGVLPILLASFLSGLAGALVQMNVQGGGHQISLFRKRQSLGEVSSSSSKKKPKNFYLFSTELGLASIFLLLVSFAFSADGSRIVTNGFFHGWTPSTLLPILTQSAGGITVGLVTKHAGSVRKGFALIFGMLLSGLVQAMATGTTLGVEQVIGLCLASTSLLLHTRYPYDYKSKQLRPAYVARR